MPSVQNNAYVKAAYFEVAYTDPHHYSINIGSPMPCLNWNK